jgi:peptide/nickel transport system ATP-binding protein
MLAHDDGRGGDVTATVTLSETSQPEPLVKVNALTKVFDVSPPWLVRATTRQSRQVLRAVDGVSFSIPEGRTLSLVGESGCGKTTVARCIAGLSPPTSGEISYRGVPIMPGAEARPAWRREIQMIFQDPYGSLNPRWRVGRIVADPIVALGLKPSRAEVKEQVEQLLADVGLSPADATKYPHEFSGGQRQRIAVARALASAPALIICDEPTSALDVSIQAQILNLMRDLQDEHGLTYLFISHNLAVVDFVSDQVAVMYLGRIVEIADRETLFGRPGHPYTRVLTGSVPGLAEIGARRAPMLGEVPNPIAPPPGCPFHPRCPLAIARCRAEAPQLKPFDAGLVACHRAGELA